MALSRRIVGQNHINKTRFWTAVRLQDEELSTLSLKVWMNLEKFSSKYIVMGHEVSKNLMIICRTYLNLYHVCAMRRSLSSGDCGGTAGGESSRLLKLPKGEGLWGLAILSKEKVDYWLMMLMAKNNPVSKFLGGKDLRIGCGRKWNRVSIPITWGLYVCSVWCPPTSDLVFQSLNLSTDWFSGFGTLYYAFVAMT